MSNNTTKTEMVAEMKSTYKENNAREGRSLRRVNYTINEKKAIKKIMQRSTNRDKDGERE